jgi:hypothetical protein
LPCLASSLPVSGGAVGVQRPPRNIEPSHARIISVTVSHMQLILEVWQISAVRWAAESGGDTSPRGPAFPLAVGSCSYTVSGLKEPMATIAPPSLITVLVGTPSDHPVDLQDLWCAVWKHSMLSAASPRPRAAQPSASPRPTIYGHIRPLTGRVARVPPRTVTCAGPRTAQPTRLAICRDPAKRGGVHASE